MQLFAEERTEEATPRKLQEARKEGKAARSQDLAAGIGLVAAATALKSGGLGLYQRLAGGMESTLAQLGPTDLTPDRLQTLFEEWALLFGLAWLPIVLIILVVGVVVGLIQGRLTFSAKPLTPDFTRLNPGSGIKRIFSLRTLVEQVKAIIKLAVIGVIGYRQVAANLPTMPNLLGQNVAVGAVGAVMGAVDALRTIGIWLVCLGVLDYGYQYWEYRKSLRMTKQEVKQEHKQQEGNPELKQKQRQRARELALRRKAIKEVPTADVVITNPTHFAVAIRYTVGQDSAPMVVAKGADLLAQRIKVLAKEHKVPTVENKALARALYANVEIGKAVPPDLYQAVAEVLAFVYSLRRQSRRSGIS